MAESTVQVSPSGGGPNVRTATITEQQADGTYVTTQMQVVVLANPDGSLAGLAGIDKMVDLLTTTNALLRALSLQMSFMNSPRINVDDLTPFIEGVI